MKQKKLISIITLAAFVIFFSACPEPVEVVDKELTGVRVAFLIGEGFHDGETLFPLGFLVNRGADVTIIGVAAGYFQAYNSDVTVWIDKTIDEVSVDQFDVLVIPGGRSPSYLREYDEVVEFVRQFVEQEKVTAAICHGPQVLITAGVVEGRHMTGVEGIKNELIEAGAVYDDQAVIQDNNIITSRIPGDLPVFCLTIANALKDAI